MSQDCLKDQTGKTGEELPLVSAQFSSAWHLAYQRLQLIFVPVIVTFQNTWQKQLMQRSTYCDSPHFRGYSRPWRKGCGTGWLSVQWQELAEQLVHTFANQEIVNLDQKWVRLSLLATMPLTSKVPSTASQNTTSWGPSVQTHKLFSYPNYNFPAFPDIILQPLEPPLGQSVEPQRWLFLQGALFHQGTLLLPEKKLRTWLWNRVRSHLLRSFQMKTSICTYCISPPNLITFLSRCKSAFLSASLLLKPGWNWWSDT